MKGLGTPACGSHSSPPTDLVPLWVYVFITGVSILLVASVILLVVCMTWRISGKGSVPGLLPLFPRPRLLALFYLP